MILIFKNSPFTYPFDDYKLHFTNQLVKKMKDFRFFQIYANKHVMKHKSWTFNFQKQEQEPLISMNKNKKN